MNRTTCPLCGGAAYPVYDRPGGTTHSGLVCASGCSGRHVRGRKAPAMPGTRCKRPAEPQAWRALLRPTDTGSDLELEMLARLRAAGCEPEAREFAFARPRRWRFDFAWPSIRLAVEVQGGVWSGGRHVRPAGFAAECERRNAAGLAGWCVLEYPADAIHSGRAELEVAAVVASRMGQSERADRAHGVRGRGEVA